MVSSHVIIPPSYVSNTQRYHREANKRVLDIMQTSQIYRQRWHKLHYRPSRAGPASEGVEFNTEANTIYSSKLSHISMKRLIAATSICPDVCIFKDNNPLIKGDKVKLTLYNDTNSLKGLLNIIRTFQDLMESIDAVEVSSICPFDAAIELRNEVFTTNSTYMGNIFSSSSMSGDSHASSSSMSGDSHASSSRDALESRYLGMETKTSSFATDNLLNSNAKNTGNTHNSTIHCGDEERHNGLRSMYTYIEPYIDIEPSSRHTAEPKPSSDRARLDIEYSIKVIAYNRPRSLYRLLKSLADAEYPINESQNDDNKSNKNTSISLTIYIDGCKDSNFSSNQCLLIKESIEVADNFKWRFGTKSVIARESNFGLPKQW